MRGAQYRTGDARLPSRRPRPARREVRWSWRLGSAGGADGELHQGEPRIEGGVDGPVPKVDDASANLDRTIWPDVARQLDEGGGDGRLRIRVDADGQDFLTGGGPDRVGDGGRGAGRVARVVLAGNAPHRKKDGAGDDLGGLVGELVADGQAFGGSGAEEIDEPGGLVERSCKAVGVPG